MFMMIPMPRRVGAIVVVLLSLTMVGRAKAQSGPYDDDDEKGAQRQPSKEAVELLLTGEELMGAGRYAEALQKLTGSLKLFMSARTQLGARRVPQSPGQASGSGKCGHSGA